MFFVIGTVIVSVSVVGGYLAGGGHLDVLWQPLEFVIIFGAGLGGFVIANPKSVVVEGLKAPLTLIKGARHKKPAYLELLGVLYAVFKLAKTKGDLALEPHLDSPRDSALFQKFPSFIADHHSVEFLCDYLRLLTLGASNAHEVEAVIDEELEQHEHHSHEAASAVQTVADALPALGIVAAVLGVIHTMGSITEPPEVLGHLIGAALVGTFSGVLASYGFVGPMALAMIKIADADARYLQCIKTGLVAHMQGYAPQVSVEFARKSLPGNVRPTFIELEEWVQNLPSD